MQGTDPLIGQNVDGYLVQDLLGHGGMGRVYQALDVNLNRYAALKVMTAPPHKADEYQMRFDREAQAIAKLKHTNIVAIYRFNQVDDIYYMAMEYVDGADLRWVLRDYAANQELIDYKTLYAIVTQIGKALDYAHRNKVIHRDIKPSNIMISRSGEAILTDFGLALDTDEGTRGEIFGSPHYIAPEQAVNSAKAVPQTDIYSLGVVIYEMLTGSKPFNEGTALQVAMAHISDTLPDPRTLNPNLHDTFIPVLDKALEKDPKQRYQTANALAKDLKAAIRAAVNDNSIPKASTLDPASRIQRQINPLPQPAASVGTKPLTMIADAPRPNPDIPSTKELYPPPQVESPQRRSKSGLWFLLIVAFGALALALYPRSADFIDSLGAQFLVTESAQQPNTFIEGVISDIETGAGYINLTIYGITVQVERAHPLYDQAQTGNTVRLEGNTVTVQGDILRFRQIDTAIYNGDPIIIEIEEPED